MKINNNCFCVVAILRLFCATFYSDGAVAQELMYRNALVRDLGILARPGQPNYRLKVTGKLQYSLTGSFTLFFNWQKTNQVNQVFILQDFKYSSLVEDNGKVRLINTFLHNLGVQFLFDSITRFQHDENILNTRLDVLLCRSWAFSLSSVLSTRLFNEYNITENDSGARVSILSSGFLTPMLLTISAGFTLSIGQTGKLVIGISSAKLTYVMNSQVYRDQKSDTYFGAPESKGYNLEYGLALQLLIDRDIFKRLHWNCDLLLFKNYLKPVDMSVKNMFTLRISKFLQANIQTRLFYEEEVSKKVQVESLFSLGFYFHL